MLKFEYLPVLTKALLDNIEPGKDAGAELMSKQWDSGEAVIILKNADGSEVDRFHYEPEPGMTGAEFKRSLMGEGFRLVRAAE